jgi:flavorubredoxin
MFLVAGEQHSAFVEAGITADTTAIFGQIDRIGGHFPEPRYILPTHSEMAHAGGVGRLSERFPLTTTHGDVSDLHLVFPELRGRLHFADTGTTFDLGGTQLVVVESVFRDLVRSKWYFDTARGVLFPGDGFAYSHYHEPHQCGRFAEEVPTLDVTAGMARFGLSAFHWTRYVDIAPYVSRLHSLVFDELDVKMIAPTHGLPIRDPAVTMPMVEAGLKAMARPSGA